MKLLSVVFLAFFIGSVLGSSHSEAPGTASNPSSDLADWYFFRAYETGKTDNVVMIANVYPGQKPQNGPNYYTISDSHMFEFIVSCNNNNTVNADHTFQFFFGARMGGNIGNELNTFDETDQCSYGETFDLTGIHTGVALVIGPTGNQRTNPVPLKVLQPLSAANPAGANGLQNWFEYYSVNYKSRSGTVTHLKADGTNSETFSKPFDYVGEKTFGSASDYEAYARTFIHSISGIPTCPSSSGRVFVGSRADPFHIDLGRTFDLINYVPIPGFPNAVKNCPENDDIGISNIDAIVLEIPISCLPCNRIPGEANILGSYARVGTLVHEGSEHVFGEQVSRLGSPLVNEVVIGLPDKKFFSTSTPNTDGQFLDYVTHPTFPEIVNILFKDTVNQVLGTSLSNIAPNNFPRTDLIAAFLTGIPELNQPLGVAASELLRCNLDIAPTAAADQNRYGVLGGDNAGFPNGRRPGDDALDIVLRVAMGALCWVESPAGSNQFPYCAGGKSAAPVGNVEFLDGAPVDASDFDAFFPYLTTPNPGSVTNPHPGKCSGESPAALLVPSFVTFVLLISSLFFFF